METLPKKQKRYPTPRQRKAAKAIVENLQSDKPVSTGEVLKSVGYGTGLQNQPNRVIESEGFQKILAEYLPEEMLAEKHVQLLNATRIDHMVFPLGPKDEDDANFSGGGRKKKNEDDDSEEFKERTTLTDEEIIIMLKEVNCQVRRIVHGETARHVYFWSADNMARDKALDKAYKLRRRYGEEQGMAKAQAGNTYNFIFSEEVQGKVKEMNDQIKEMLINSHAQEN